MKKLTKRPRYSIDVDACDSVWIHDRSVMKNKQCRRRGFIIRCHIQGEGYCCGNSFKEAKALARKVCRFLNKETP